MRKFENKYGYFDEVKKEYVITRPDTPRPWVNVICPGDYGMVVSQSGSGYSWKTHASLNRITRWEQDLVRDEWGKYLFIRDDESGEYWSATWKPVTAKPDFYQVRHGVGYSVITSKNQQITSELTMFVPKDEPVEIWKVQLTNESNQERTLSLFSYMEWALGAAPDWHREFHKTFIETTFDKDLNAMKATKRLWELVNDKGQHWNRSWEYVAFHSVNEKVQGFEGDKENFLGMYHSIRDPKAVLEGKVTDSVGKWGDGIGSLHNSFTLKPGETKTLIYLLGAIEEEQNAQIGQIIQKYQDIANVEIALKDVKEFWNGLLSTVEVDSPDDAFNLMNNVWLKYQAISARMWGRTAYYQTGGAYGFRDQLQDSQLFLMIDPKKTKGQIKLHASRQFVNGKVNHWWHPLSGEGAYNNISDNLLWMPFVTLNYLKETADDSILDERVSYMDDPKEASIYKHCLDAIHYVLSRLSPRGLPLIGTGDWNDGMNAVGFDDQGESVWMGHFLYGILQGFIEIAAQRGDDLNAKRFDQEADQLKQAINEHAWDGEWFIRATCDDGTVIGSNQSEYGKIFLNAQTWSIIHDTADQERKKMVLESVKKYLSREYGPILFYPAYQEPQAKIGYLTRYAPGVREHAGLYTHAATWGVQAAAMMKDAEAAWKMYKNMCPVYRGCDPDHYKAEPYVTPGNVDGPDSPNFGRGGWTWYTGSAGWMFRIGIEWILGVRSERDGLRIDPCIPKDWSKFKIKREFRGSMYEIMVNNPQGVSFGVKEVQVDGNVIDSNLVPIFNDGKVHQVEVLLG